MTVVDVNADAIPAEFKERDQWLLFDASGTVVDDDRQPHWDGRPVSWNAPDAWHSFEEAAALAREHDAWGVGYVLALGNDSYPEGKFGMIDIDGAVKDNGALKDWVPPLSRFEDALTYMEYSASGNGAHIPVTHTPPSWWKDSHFSDEEHEGVEVLTNSFCTFTGDVFEQAGSGVADIDATPWLLEAYKNIRGEYPRKATEGTESSRTNDEWLTEDLVREALDELDPDCGYTEWRDIAFAVHDFDDGATGRALFEEWSRQGTKFDDDAEQKIERFWNDTDQGSGITAATLVHKAKEAGWSPSPQQNRPRPRPSNGGGGGDDDHPEATTEPPSWSAVRDNYQLHEGNGPGRMAATYRLDEEFDWMYVVESEKLWVYDEDRGFFNQWGEQFVAKVLEENLHEHYSSTEKKEVIARLQARHQTHREELNARSHDGYHLCVGNGVIDLETGARHEHDPSYKFTRGLEWDYEPAKADPEPVLGFLDDITKREADRDTLLDHLAHGLMPGHPYRAFVLTYGPGSNGKTQMGRLFREFVGESNTASVELQDFTSDDFSTGALPGAFINIGDDVSVAEIRDMSIIKSLTGGGTVRANEKHEKKYDFRNEAAMFFSANEPPRFGESTEAVGDRLYPIEMPYRFVEDSEYVEDDPRLKRRTPQIAQKLTENDAAMRGLLLLAVKHAQELIESDGQYSMPEGPRERRAMYEAASDPIKRFALDYLEQGDEGDKVLKDDAFDVYKEMCRMDDERVAHQEGFKNQISKQAIIDIETGKTRALTPGSSQDTCWKYLRFSEDARQFMAPRLEERYFDSADAETTESEDEPTESESEDSGIVPLAGVEDAYSGPGSLSVEVAVKSEIEPRPWLQAEGTVRDDSEELDFKARGDENPLPPNAEGERFLIHNVRLDTGEFGETLLEFRPDTKFVSLSSTPADQQSVTEPVADGGTGDERSAEGWDPEPGAEGPPANARRARAALAAADRGALPREELRKAMVRRYPKEGLQPSEMDHGIDKATEEGLLVEEDGQYRRP